MDDRPRQRKERYAVALEVQGNEFAPAAAGVSLLTPRHEHSGLEIDDLTSPLIDDAKHERAAAAIRRDQRAAAEDDLRNRTRETREDDAGDDRESEQSDESFDRDDHIQHLMVGDSAGKERLFMSRTGWKSHRVAFSQFDLIDHEV